MNDFSKIASTLDTINPKAAPSKSEFLGEILPITQAIRPFVNYHNSIGPSVRAYLVAIIIGAPIITFMVSGASGDFGLGLFIAAIYVGAVFASEGIITESFYKTANNNVSKTKAKYIDEYELLRSTNVNLNKNGFNLTIYSNISLQDTSLVDFLILWANSVSAPSFTLHSGGAEIAFWDVHSHYEPHLTRSIEKAFY